MSNESTCGYFGLLIPVTGMFKVNITHDEVTIYEMFTPPCQKATITQTIWERIAEPIKNEWNARLRRCGEPAGYWLPTTNIDRAFGKELVLLAWALEDAPLDAVQTILEAWQKLNPEERWWLFSTTNARCNQPGFGKDTGWRKAIRVAFMGTEDVSVQAVAMQEARYANTKP